jgi:hypothetical protein
MIRPNQFELRVDRTDYVPLLLNAAADPITTSTATHWIFHPEIIPSSAPLHNHARPYPTNQPA